MLSAIEQIKSDYDYETAKEIVNHGCESGVCFKHIYYADSIEFFNKFPNEIIDGIKSNLEELGLSKRQMETLVNSGYSQYSNAVTNMMGEKVPDDTMYIYIGAYDNKTRLACERKIQDSPASKESILGKYGNLDNEIWNCRHKWEPIDPKSTSMDLQAQGFEDKKSA